MRCLVHYLFIFSHLSESLLLLFLQAGFAHAGVRLVSCNSSVRLRFFHRSLLLAFSLQNVQVKTRKTGTFSEKYIKILK